MRSDGRRSPQPETGAEPTVPAGVVCRRCHYDLRGAAESGRCPECGLAIGLSLSRSHFDSATTGGGTASGDAWEPIASGCRLHGAAVFALLPICLGGPLIPIVGALTLVALGLHGLCHFLAMRDLQRGLTIVSQTDPFLGDALQRAMRAAKTHGIIAGIAGALPLVPCLTWSAIQLPGGTQLVAAALVLPSLFVALWSARKVAMSLASSTALIAALPNTHLGDWTLAAGAVAACGAWILLALISLVDAAGAVALQGVLVVVAMAVSLALLLPLALYRDLFMRLSIAVPQLAAFNAAADRIERSPGARRADLTLIEPPPVSHGHLQVIDDDAPIPLADDPIRPDQQPS